VIEKSRVIFNSIVSRDGASPEVELPGLERPVIGTVGLFKGSKGLPYLLRAFRTIRESRRSSLVVVGDVREVERKIQNRYFSRFGSDHVYVTGPVPHESIGSYLRRMDVFVLPSLSEGCPNVLLEAMAAARPIVATRTGAIPEMIHDGESGILVEPGESSELSNAILYLLDHPEKAAAMGQRALQSVSDFSQERERQAWRDVYEHIQDLDRRGRIELT
jgi:glycosyltransferase involved in cell wall biosynthesis